MTPNRTSNISSARRVLDQVHRGGKKTVVAGVLMLLMLFMWVRVFLGHRPAATAAATAEPVVVRAESTPRPAPLKVKLVELPKLPGRHDAMKRDFFTVKERGNSSARKPGTEQEVPVTASNHAQEVIRRVAQTMKLTAVLWSNTSPRAFINDQLLGVGGKLTVTDGAALLEFEVLQIDMDSVRVGCNDMQLTLELTQNLEVVR
jgi:hypothetical protein